MSAAERLKMSYSPAMAGYGARLFLETPVPPEVDAYFNHWCKWGGADKSGINFRSWEFAPQKVGGALQVASDGGYIMDNQDWEEWGT